MPDKPKILVISASPMENGHVEQLLSLFCEKAFALDADIDIVRLADVPPPPVTGKLEKWEPDSAWASKIEAADAIVIGTPTYWFGPPAPLKQWFDALTPHTYHSTLHGKLFGCVVYGPEGGAACLTQWLGMAACNMGFTIPAYGLIWQEGATKKGHNQWVFKALPALAENIIALLEALASVKEDATPYLADTLRRYRARGGKASAGLSAFVVPLDEQDTEIVEDAPGTPES